MDSKLLAASKRLNESHLELALAEAKHEDAKFAFSKANSEFKEALAKAGIWDHSGTLYFVALATAFTDDC